MGTLILPRNESERLKKIERCQILDTPSEQMFDDIVLIASEVCKTPISLITIVDKDRQWFKAKIGPINSVETSRDCSFCTHTIIQDEIFIVEDARIHPDFKDNPLVLSGDNIVFYAGVPLVTSDGYAIGSLCVIDKQPRTLTKSQIVALEALGREVVHLIELRNNNLKILQEKTAAESKMNHILEFIDQIIWSLDLNLKLNYCNDAMFIKTGYSSKEIMADPEIFINLVLPEDRSKVETFINDIKKNKKASTTFKLKHKLGKVFEFNASAKLIEENGVPIRIDGIYYDITDINEAQRIILDQKNKIVLASRLEALGQISSSIAHEIKNPLGIISTTAGYLGCLCEDKDSVPSKDVIKVTKKIEDTAIRISKIIKSLRTFSRDSSNDPLVTTSLKTMIEESMDLYYNRFKNDDINLSIDVIPKDVYVDCKSSEIYQVLINLINNSYDAVHNLKEKWVKITYTDLGSAFEVAVTDSGSAISLESQKRLFEPFFTTKEVGYGTGLGLSICERIISAHGGIIRYDNLSANTRFIIRLNKSVKKLSTLKAA
jgi:PAS domain S-box-containing protein